VACRVYDALFSLPLTIETFRSKVRCKALLIVPSYLYSEGNLTPLSSTMNDALEWQKILKRRGYRSEDIVVLSDTLQPRYHATADNIRRELRDLMYGVQPGQTRFLLFSGHRISLPSTIYRNRRYGAILPSEGISHIIPDSALCGYLLRYMRPGIRLTVIMDSCHVGLPLPLPWLYDLDRHEEFRVMTPWKAASYALGSIVVIGASEAHQQAREVEEEDGKKYGGLSYFLTKAFHECEESSEGLSQQELCKVAKTLIDGGQNMVLASSVLSHDFHV